jgi:hypothetical protein
MASGEQSGIRALSGRAAPARGLTLERVIYHDNDALAETERAGT